MGEECFRARALVAERERSLPRRQAERYAGDNRLDPDPRGRRVFSFHRPETLLAWLHLEKQLAQRLQELPPLAVGSLRLAQIEAIIRLDKSFAAGLLRAFI